LRQTWTYEVTDLAKIPAQWLCLNEPLVKAAIKTGTREIPGLRIYAEHKAFVR
jgi:hypothetical protein